MISLGLYGECVFYKDLLQANSDLQIEYIDFLDNINDMSNYNVLLVQISEFTDEEITLIAKRLSKISLTKVVYLNDDYTFHQLKELMYHGAHDCIKRDIDFSELNKIIRNAINLFLKEARENKKLKAYTMKSIRESLAYDLLHGNIKSAKEIWERVQLAKLSLIPNIVLTLSIDHFSEFVRDKGDSWKRSLREEVITAIDQHQLGYESIKIPVNQGSYAILLSLPVQLEEENYIYIAIEYAENIREKVNRETDYTVTVGIGNYYEDARNLHISYQESERAQKYQFFSASDSIIHIGDINYYKTPTYYEFKVQIQEMVNKFSLGDISAVCKIWETINQSVAAHRNFQPEEFRLQVLDLLFSLSKSSIQNGANPKYVLPIQIKYAKELDHLKSLAEIDKWMKEIIQELFNYVNQGHNEQILKSVQHVLQYLEEHFHEDIGLEVVSEKVKLSPNYLSAIFKQTTGSSFIDYVTDLRMKKAKEKLSDLNLSVYEIAELIGYNSSQYFSRVFKNNIGMTPSAYRNKILATKSNHTK